AIVASTTLVSVLPAGCAEDAVSEDGTDQGDTAGQIDATPGTTPANKDAGVAADTGHAPPADAAHPDAGASDAQADGSGSDASTACPPPDTCPTAKALPNVSADNGNDVQTIQGTTSD